MNSLIETQFHGPILNHLPEFHFNPKLSGHCACNHIGPFHALSACHKITESHQSWHLNSRQSCPLPGSVRSMSLISSSAAFSSSVLAGAAGTSLRVLWPRKLAWILVAALCTSGSLRSISATTETMELSRGKDGRKKEIRS